VFFPAIMPVASEYERYKRLDALLETMVDDELAELKRQTRDYRVYKREEYANLPAVKQMRSNGRQNLERYERAMAFLFEHGGIKPGYLQKRFMQSVLRVSLRRMFGKELLANMPFLRERLGIESAERAACILYPRRSGKTTAQTMDAAVTLVSQPNGNVVCFNLTGRQSAAWMKQCMRYLDVFRQSGSEFAWTVHDRKMPERLVIEVPALGTRNTVMAFPGAQAARFDNLRGMGERLAKIYVDEAAFFDENCMGVMAPLAVLGASLILTSSIAPGGARAGLMKILDAKHKDGHPAVLEVNFIQACRACQVKGLSDQCEHRIHLPQHFQNAADLEFVEVLMSPWEGTAGRELYNVHDKPLMYALLYLLLQRHLLMLLARLPSSLASRCCVTARATGT
jgi:hypothetical protein